MLFFTLWTIVGALILTLAFVGIALIVSESRKEDGADFEIFPDTDKASRAAAPADHRFTRAK